MCGFDVSGSVNIKPVLNQSCIKKCNVVDLAKLIVSFRLLFSPKSLSTIQVSPIFQNHQHKALITAVLQDSNHSSLLPLALKAPDFH